MDKPLDRYWTIIHQLQAAMPPIKPESLVIAAAVLVLAEEVRIAGELGGHAGFP